MKIICLQNGTKIVMKFSKSAQLSSELLVIDGLWGCGKSVVMQLLSVFDSMESCTIDYLYDYIPDFSQSQSMTRDAAVCLIRSKFDDLTYQKCISRSVNFRYKDQTSIFKHPKKYQYLLRLLQNGGDQSLNNINANKLIIPIFKHLSSTNNDLFHMALGER